MKVVAAPKITFRCSSCGATNEGDPDEFEEQNTMPPSWIAECAFCQCRVRCFPAPLMARTVGRDAAFFREWVDNMIVRQVMES